MICQWIQKAVKNNNGFTLVEVLITMGIFTILVATASINLLKPIQSNNTGTSISEIVSNVKSQQSRSMRGDLDTSAFPDSFGVRFEQTQYIIFKGDLYSPLNPDNVAKDLPPTLAFQNINLPNQSIIFSRVSGEVVDYNAATNSVDIVSEDGNNYRITVNKIGALDVTQL
ncbi:MAG: prepilin-type N-terminal cleavage/methylation domain-containing protein [Patescibacteria group bacterium]|uniref:Prepilin-type N-terminal cleavage/methylation domain-containing protein n=1 Tax=candidate division WWE3 bacterium TaxID=2053526 RepID=A0A955ED99_UNCKA|nr:prepilin-type N-terminal cleavage/methylation domain-containing protein [candidate division WWE3 bacterium]